MSYQKKFSDGVIARLREKIKTGEQDLVNLYLNKNDFSYSFKNEDFAECDFPSIPKDLGSKMVNTFNIYSNQREDNVVDFRTSDFECAKVLYESIRITPRQAADKDFWNYLHHFELYEYIHLRWNEIENPSRTSTDQYILGHWLMNNSSQKQLINYPLTGLWWSIHLSQDEFLDEKYELSKIYFGNNRTRTTTFGGSSFVRHKEALLGILEFLYENDIYLNREKGDKIGKFINLLGGTKPLGFFDRDWFKLKLEDRFSELVKRDKKNINRSKTSVKNPYDEHQNTDLIGETKEKVLPVLKERSTPLALHDKILSYLWLYKEGKYSLNSYPTGDVPFCIPIYKKHQNGFLLQFYDNGRVNKVPISHLLTKTIDPKVPHLDGLNQDANLLEIKCISEDCLLWVTVMDGRKGKAGKIFRTSWLPEKRTLEDRGTLISNNTNNLNYAILPENLDRQLTRLIQRGSSSFGYKNNKFYKKEWEFIKDYFKELLVVKNGDLKPVAPRTREAILTRNEIGKYLNIYESGLFYFSQTSPLESHVKSILLPNLLEDKYLYFCYDNGQVTKFPLQKLPDLDLEQRERNGKYSRAGLIYFEIGDKNSNILLCREQRNYGRCYKIHDGNWLPESNKMNERGTEVVNTLNKLSFKLLPPFIDQRLNNLKGKEPNKRVLLDHPANSVQKALLYKLVPEFFT